LSLAGGADFEVDFFGVLAHAVFDVGDFWIEISSLLGQIKADW
jgi:hypothetical protein